MEIQSRYYTVNDIQLHTLEAGPEQGPLLIFLHGFPEYSGAWTRQLEFFSGRGYRVIAPDQRGYNLSDKPSGTDFYRGELLAGDIAALIRQLGDGPVNLAGHDWGGMVSWYVAIQYPDLIKKLIVINCPHPRVFFKTLRSSGAQRKRSWYAAFFRIPSIPEAMLRAGNFYLLRRSLLSSSLPNTFTNDTLQAYIKAWSQPGALRAMLNWYRALTRSSKDFIRNKSIEVPTLLIWGKKDKFLGEEMAAPSIELCADGQLRFAMEQTHWIHHEKPEIIHKWSLDFLENS